MGNQKRINQTAPYFVQMREQERRLILSTLEVVNQMLPAKARFKARLQMAAELLGVELAYLRVRARLLGGVLEGDPKHEPPTLTTTQAWNRNPNKPALPKPSVAPKPLHQPPKLTIVQPEVEESEDEVNEPDPRNSDAWIEQSDA